jgi:hypothetical protein
MKTFHEPMYPIPERVPTYQEKLAKAKERLKGRQS